jgi:hypothetical protein
MKFTADRPYADPEQAVRKIVEIATPLSPCGMAAFTSKRSKSHSCKGARHAVGY